MKEQKNWVKKIQGEAMRDFTLNNSTGQPAELPLTGACPGAPGISGTESCCGSLGRSAKLRCRRLGDRPGEGIKWTDLRSAVICAIARGEEPEVPEIKRGYGLAEDRAFAEEIFEYG